MPPNRRQTNEFEAMLNKRIRQFELNEIASILEEERIRKGDSEEDELSMTMSSHRANRTRKRWPALRRMQRWLRQNAAYGRLQLTRFFRKKAFHMKIRYESIKKQHLFAERLNASGQLESAVEPLPANVPYCQTGKSSLIAALKQFNWSHTQGPFVYNQQQL